MAKANKAAEGQQDPNTAPAQQAPPPPPQDGIIATKAPPREPIPAGNHVARCYLMILLGTVPETFAGSDKVVPTKKIRIGWEFPTLLVKKKDSEEEYPMAISAEYTLSTSSRANLRKVIDSWRGKALTEQQADAFDVTVLLGKACMINIIHKAGEGKHIGKVFEVISSIASIPKGLPVPEPINESKYFNYGSKFDAKYVNSLPDFIKNKILSSAEYKAKIEDGTVAAQLGAGGINDASHEPNPYAPPVSNIPDEDLPF